MKEEDARKKWCPMVRITQLSHMVSSNRESFKLTDTDRCDRCLASNCMMWVETDNECDPVPPDAEVDRCYPAGYCGLTHGR